MLKFQTVCVIGVYILASFATVSGNTYTKPTDTDKADIMPAKIVQNIGEKITCLAANCNIDGIYKVIKSCVNRSRALPRDEKKTIDELMVTLSTMLMEIENDVGAVNPKCKKLPYKCVHDQPCAAAVPEEIKHLGKYFRSYGAVSNCLYEVPNHKVIEQTKIIALSGLEGVALSKDGTETAVGIINNIVRKVMAKMQELDNGRCANVVIKDNYCV